MIGTLVLIGCLLVLWLIGKKSVTAEVTIHASGEKVWQSLTRFEQVREWNKVLIPIEGTMQEGKKIKYEFYQAAGKEATVMRAKVKAVTTEKLIHQTGGLPLVLTFNHKYILEQQPHATKVIIHEEYRGLMVPFWSPKPVALAYERLLNSLKDEVVAATNAHKPNN